MSSANKSFGTQSPPLEATGDDQPMGVSSINGDKPQAVSDKQQRQGYFENEKGSIADDMPSRVSGSQGEKSEKIKTD
ncbi:hypothetical protein L227DRAFT_652670 [Lentinus tigrinus ALCF2SS1-6]|uniref:Uncharacterized protein n=1 Tax=Lentinus tigrinus ALCF2SS1-6 TaxID=1328759 RepID=A0A5C2SDT9_9APHY|nr:hypothetical protein L227DRAFT_652670 [Lentinus tigrinus ALCF2SS1-6]